MKRIFSILFALCLVLTLALSVSAESTNKLTYAVEASASTVSANTEFTVLVKVTENTGICWVNAVVTYDSSVLTYVSASTDTGAFSGGKFEIVAKNGEIVITLGGMGVLWETNPTIYTNTGTFVALTFKVNADATPTTTKIDVSTVEGNAVKIVNSNADFDFALTAASTSVKISADKPHTCTAGAETKENVVPATCLSVGKYDAVVRCTICDKVMSTKTVIIPVTEDHVPGTAVKENEKAGDCKTASSYDSVVYCTLCSKEISRTKTTGEKGSHVAGTPEVTVTDATCQKTGSIVEVYKCSVCGTQMDKKTTELAITDHVKGTAVVENLVEATCTKGGSYVSAVYCVTCNKLLSSETKTTEKVPHSPANAVEENRKEPVNCGADGTYESVVYCSVCKAEISRVTQSIPAPAHTPGPAATETTPQICTVCNAMLASPIGHSHKWDGTLSTDANGHWYACSGCGEKKDYAAHSYDNNCDADCNICGFKRTPADHVFGAWAIIDEATETDDGLRQRDCIICGATESEKIPATGETETSAPDVTTEITPPDTSDPEVTTEEPSVTTDPVDTTDPVVTSESTTDTDAPEQTDPVTPDSTDNSGSDDGCGSAVSMGIALIAILGTALIMKKRD